MWTMGWSQSIHQYNTSELETIWNLKQNEAPPCTASKSLGLFCPYNSGL